MSSWFTKTETLESYVPPKEGKKGENKGGNWPFYMKKGTSTKIAFLTGEKDDIPVIHYHALFIDNKPVLVACTNGDPTNPKKCGLCAYDAALPKDAHYSLKTGKKVGHAFTVLDMTENTNDEGEIYPFRKKLRLSNKMDMVDIQTKVHEIQHDLPNVNSLKYAIIKVARPDTEKAPGVGVLGSVLGSLNTDDYEDLEPFTPEEIMDFFIHDEAALDEIYAQYPLLSDKKPLVKVKR